MQKDDAVLQKRGERLAFEIYLRTGKTVTQASEELQVKFNPWHDPENGRFTFAGQGRYYGRGDGRHHTTTSKPAKRAPKAASPASSADGRPNIFKPGGSDGFGGGGASGSWSGPSDKRRSAPKTEKPAVTAGPSAVRQRPAKKTPAPSAPVPVTSKPAPLRITSNGYHYEVSSQSASHRRTERVSGELQLAQVSQRSRREQSQAGGADRKPSDDGGHFIAARFNGPRKWFNHFAQDSNFNRGAYRAIEDGWAKDIKAGKRVFVDIVPLYAGRSTRPDKLTIRWTVDGKRYVRTFPNKRKDK